MDEKMFLLVDDNNYGIEDNIVFQTISKGVCKVLAKNNSRLELLGILKNDFLRGEKTKIYIHENRELSAFFIPEFIRDTAYEINPETKVYTKKGDHLILQLPDKKQYFSLEILI